MKEAYFTRENINRISRNIYADLEKYSHRHRSFTISRDTAALLVLDMQKCFFQKELSSHIPSAYAVKSNITDLASLFISMGMPVICTRHLNTEKDAGMMSSWWKNLIRKDSVSSCLIDEICRADAVFLEKSQYDAFYNTGLESLLNERGINQVIITGVMTNVCCDTTARSAFVRGFEVFFTIDGTAAYSMELHISSLKSLSHCCAVPVLCETVKKTLNTGSKKNG